MHTITQKANHDVENATAAAAPSLTIQAKLLIGDVNDPLEHEADAMADKVMRMQEVPATVNRGGAGIQRKCAGCEEEEKVHRKPLASFIQRKESFGGTAVSDSVSNRINANKGNGSNMNTDTQSFMQNRFGMDFSGVKIHTDGEAIQMSSEMNAKAFTVGNDIYFNEGQYRPDSDEGRHLLAHELTHTIQQGGGIATKIQREVKCDAGKEADKKTGCIQPIVIADDDGKNPTTAPSFAQVKAIWGKCCTDYTINAAQTIKKTAYKTLDESPTNVPTAEETSMFADAGASTCIQVFVPETFAQGGKTGKKISGGGGTYDAGTANPKIVIVEGAVSEVVAHEVGHASGYLGHDANTTVMKPTGAHDSPNSTDVSADVCAKARSGPVLTGGVKKDCCMRY